MAVDGQTVERGLDTGDRELLALAELMVDSDARKTRQRFCNIVVGELAHILGRDDVDDRVRLALGSDRIPNALADPGDDDGVVVGLWSNRCAVCRRLIGGVLSERGAATTQHRRSQKNRPKIHRNTPTKFDHSMSHL